jgi:hypothetical protein
MAEYTRARLSFIKECNKGFDDLCDAIDRGDVPAGRSAKLSIEIPPDIVDQVRFDRLASAASVD